MENLGSLADKLNSEIEQCDWAALVDHHSRGAVYFIDPALDLAEVGVALALDDKEKVKAWLTSLSLRNPLPEEIETFEKDPHKKMAEFLIIQPFVIAKRIMD